jgi:hypothetical protein
MSCCVYINEQNSEAEAGTGGVSSRQSSVESRGSRVIEQEMARRLRSDLKCQFLL